MVSAARGVHEITMYRNMDTICHRDIEKVTVCEKRRSTQTTFACRLILFDVAPSLIGCRAVPCLFMSFFGLFLVFFSFFLLTFGCQSPINIVLPAVLWSPDSPFLFPLTSQQGICSGAQTVWWSDRKRWRAAKRPFRNTLNSVGGGASTDTQLCTQKHSNSRLKEAKKR